MCSSAPCVPGDRGGATPLFNWWSKTREQSGESTHRPVWPLTSAPTVTLIAFYSFICSFYLSLSLSLSLSIHPGVFTAPVRGVYHFYFALHGHGHASFPSVISLHKNGELVVTAWCQQAGYSVNPSNGASLLLEVGDVVNLILKENARVWDNLSYPHTTFSGHLLFTV